MLALIGAARVWRSEAAQGLVPLFCCAIPPNGGFAHRIAQYAMWPTRSVDVRMDCLKSLLVFVLALGAQPASAFLDPPYIMPANPTAGELISVSIYGGGCDLVDYGINWPPPVTQQGNEITILFTGVHEGDPEFCYYGIGTATYPVGVFPPGSYTLDVERRYGSPFGSWIQETLGIIPFTVSGAPPQPPIEMPVLSGTGLASLLLTLMGAGLLALRRCSA